ncbi:MAG TPA: aminomethyl-transferring glycine dehydrogenase subunit GcvPA [candidate division Zixibacteria bacterium]|nr:aminomethyl-transferring glycine dehydrogenase subunit GcvPA [candidate division Zixibacteria bacterium]MDD4916949.1 aminomethyl-transferring glycine dehydrogenase subunit GcvPA [candidate division Zixibacteria bacterium]MDM7973052.1 aminomethyl-transferring glycine dehydrogenase subunit GcvPA [candidate division Zixibacteria bacterium]HOD67239.1 aminomethyl-transferring glycine dehydrogenase subunit GcvPA [candidate division Zixibacteria bacterium]HOZ07300.1 aminomethyl-transferring glycine
MPYVPNTDDDRRDMLKRIGVDKFEDLLEGIPSELRLKRELNIPALSEMELLREIEALSRESREGLAGFAGGGVYDHFIPAAVGAITSRPEFMTAYTPYQAEVAQGTLQAIYEYQTHVCRLTGMDVANASMYDGATAAAEAAMLAVKATGRNRMVAAETLNPMYREVIRTYLSGLDVEIVTAPMADGVTDLNRLEDAIDEHTAGVILAQPNFFGRLEEIGPVEQMIHRVGGKLVLAFDPIAQAVLKTPGEWGADIAVGEGQPLGLPVSFGGPLLGMFAVKKDLVRSMPGRLAGRTTDVEGKPGFVLVLQTREQHIRREKATSNICTNEALCATTAAVYLTLLGRTGLKRVALLSMERAQQAARALTAIDGYELYWPKPFVREFAIRTPKPAKQIILAMIERGVLPGVAAGRWYQGLDHCLIVALTEKRTEAEIGRLADGLKELAASGVLSRM